MRPPGHPACPLPLPCGCYGWCDCPPYARAACGFFAVSTMVLMSPVFFSLPESRPDAAEVARMARIGLGVFLVFAAFQFAITALLMAAAVLADRHAAASRIWGLGKVIVGMLLGSGGGVAATLLLWGLFRLG